MISSDFYSMEEPTPVIRVTALIISYNSAPALRRCLAALEATTGREQLEIIVVDCGSADESPTLDAEFPGVTILRLERNFGATKAANIGMRTAAADYVFFLAPEVLVQPETAMALAARLDADESVIAVAPLLMDESGEPRTWVRKLPSPEAMSLVWRAPDRLSTAVVDTSADSVLAGYPGREALLVRKQFIRAFNWLDERYGEFGGDLEVAFQIWRSNRKALLIPTIRATLIAAAPPDFDGAALATLSADRAHGAAVFLGKHFGWLSGVGFRFSAIFYTLGQLLTFQQPGFQFRVLSALVSGEKVDGSQRSL